MKIYFLGDLLLDEYYSVKVNRISPEAPISILASQSFTPTTVCVGGSGNAANQLKFFPIECHLFGLIDQSSKKIYENQSFVFHGSDLMDGFIPVKRRFYDDFHALARWDIEKPNYGASFLKESKQHLLTQFELYLQCKPDIVIVSDYAKGLFDNETAQQIIALCKEKNIYTIVDPKKDFFKWKGCNLIKPNAKEAYDFTGVKDIDVQLKEIQKITNCETVIVTNSSQGVHILHNNKIDWIKHNKKIDVQSVCGAGDCFSAFLSMGLCQSNMYDAVHLALNASSVYVQNKHNKPITPYELNKFIDPVKSKIMSIHDFVGVKNNIFKNEKFVFTNGCFDILHVGHIKMLDFCRTKGDKVVVAINTDNSVSNIKPGRPINTLEHRMYSLASLQQVDFVVYFEENDPKNVIKLISPQVLVKSEPYTIDTIIGADLVQEVYVCSKEIDVSTTKILKICQEKELI